MTKAPADRKEEAAPVEKPVATPNTDSSQSDTNPKE
jgi:hypothetical protein